ncbi:Glycosidase [Mucilaginibacter mallensis]|uniref:Glycosidase n=1 Tax=Mucilaginibacter mallensis TaxID=652787 RepID=A0A1H2CFX0_MUCMA|nr:alpha-amylase family glycosyl hydrolase [Mucilaginibacter mallensis]SDT69388.1 Glycosidase [Mucilaginibacter mallensis]
MKKRALLIIAGLFLLTSFPVTGGSAKVTQPPSQKEEIIYHIFQRSFFDSDGDGHGDLIGIRQKLDYLQQLGVTAILLTPLYESVYYHNYFATDFYKIDPRYGTMQDYLRLIKELHRRGMKFYMDMETQYVASDHIWFRDSYKNPQSRYSDYIIYTDKENTKPLQIVAGISDFKGYDGVTRKLVMVNLDNKEVQAYNYQLFKFWMDPNHDGKFDDGVDGFRLDHMMDNLDNLNRLPHLFTTFWNPLLGKLRNINPKIKIVAEQANWASFGMDYLKDTKIDRVFAFRLAFAIRNFNKAELIKVVDSTLIQTPKGKQQIVFIENHDMPRFSDAVKADPGKLKVGCALNLLIGGIPSIYYGQELGMQGSRQNFGITDANDIPDRQAFEWYKSDTGRGMAYWYKNGPWWQHNNNDVPNDGISLEEEQNNPQSLWNFYRTMIRLRKNNPVLIGGAYKNLINNNDHVFSFLRYEWGKKVLVAVNLSGDKQDVVIAMQSAKQIKNLYGIQPVISENNLAVSLPAYGVAVWAVK